MKMDVGAPSGGAADAGENIGTGAVKVGLIVPLTGPNGPSAVGASLRNAAKLAYADSGTSDVTILVKDDRSTPAGAAAAAQTAVNEGAEIILGPVFAGGCEGSRAASPIPPASRSSPFRPTLPPPGGAIISCPSSSRAMSIAG